LVGVTLGVDVRVFMGLEVGEDAAIAARTVFGAVQKTPTTSTMTGTIAHMFAAGGR
jgi:hypothetical protein